jgi:elongation factor P hydroxylase
MRYSPDSITAQTMDDDFLTKLAAGRYSTAFSRIHHCVVGIRKVRQDDFGGYLVDCYVPGNPYLHVFRPYELTNYVF